MGAMVSFPSNGNSLSGYLAKPESESGPGVLVIQEWWGLVGHITNVADRFAAEGFVALAPDLYHGESTTEPDEAGSLMMALDIDRAASDLRAAAAHMKSLPEVSGEKVGVVGFCMGGQLSLFTACIAPEIGAAVDYNGIHPNVKPDFAKLTSPLLGFFAENDDYASPESVAALDAELTRLGKPHEFKTYAGTGHAFFNDDRPAYHAAAAADTWNRMLAFFREHLA